MTLIRDAALVSDYIGRHRGAPEAPPVTWPAIPAGFDIYGQPICTCPMVFSDFPIYSGDCRKHGHLSRSWRTVTTTGAGICCG